MNKRTNLMISALFLFFILTIAVPVWADKHLASDTDRQKEEDDSWNLFSGISAESSSNNVLSLPDNVLKRRYVDVNINLLKETVQGRSNLLSFNLFDDVTIVGIVERRIVRSPDSYSIIGYIDGEDLGTFILTVNENVAVGTIRTSDLSLYKITYSISHIHEVRQIDENQYPPCTTVPVGSEMMQEAVVSIAEDSPDIASDDGSRFDVMVVYTQAARIAAGGTVAMEALINLAVDETNTAYANSSIIPQVNLVHTAEVSYDESSGFSDALNRLRNPSDGYMDSVHDLRDTFGADLVSLFIDNFDYCGMAYLMTTLSPSFESLAFSVVAYNCATGYYSFAHEMGHNMGCHHALPETTQGSGLYNYSMGWRFNSDTYRTIMAYSPGTRIQYFSNPDVSYSGYPTGQTLGLADEAHNALTINNVALTVANWRQAIAGAVIYVDDDAIGVGNGSSWANAYNYLQDALTTAFSGDEIWVAEGTYKPDANLADPNGTGQRTATFGPKNGVAIKGGYAGFGEPDPNARDFDAYESILSGDIGIAADNSDNSYHVVTGSGTDANTVVDGFTITAGNANGSAPDDDGGGMYNVEFSRQTLTNCTFSRNSASGDGGGMFNSNSSLTLTNCTFSGNWAGGSGGGMRNAKNTRSMLGQCTFSGNSASSNGGGVSNRQSSSILINCTFAGNSAPNGNALDCDFPRKYPSNLKVTNCILWDGGNEIWNNGNWVISGSLVEGLVAHWKLDGNADDSVGGNHGTVYGNPVWTIGQVDGALEFDGDEDYVDCGNNSSLNLTNNFSISVWVNVDDAVPGLLICKGNVQAYQSGGAYSILCIPGNGIARFYFRNSNDTGFGHAAAEVPLNQWTHVVGTFSDGNINVYKNGDFADDGTLGTTTIRSNDEPLGIGAEGDGGTPFNSIIDDVRIYDRALSEEEIRQIANCVTITYSDVQGCRPGVGSIDADPNFVDADGPDNIAGTADDNLRLSAGSPCIDAGDNNSVPADTADLDGDANTTEPTPWDLDSRPRISDGDCNNTEVVDMGAYEFAWAYVGDFDGQCDVDFADFAVFALAWLTQDGQAQYNPDCDISIPADNYIDWLDLAVLSDNWLAGLDN